MTTNKKMLALKAGTAWEAAGRPAKGAFREALTEALRALAAAKRALEALTAAPPVDAAAVVAVQQARVAVEKAEAAKNAAVNKAYSLYMYAHDFPRNGEGWPATTAEKQAHDLLHSVGFDTENGYYQGI